jgi:hypothetical protein
VAEQYAKKIEDEAKAVRRRTKDRRAITNMRRPLAIHIL